MSTAKQYKPWLHDDSLAENAELVPPQDTRWFDVLPAYWAFALILYGTFVWKLQELFRRFQ
jgi:hypothetical protein